MDIRDLIKQLNSVDENHQIEAKTGSAIDKSILETVCAFANEPHLGGGYILLGVVKEADTLFPSYNIVGISNPDKISQDLATQCAVSFNIPVRPQIETHKINEKIVIGIFVPEVSASEKPVYFTKKGLPFGAFRRVGSTDQHCTEDDLSIFYGNRSTETYDTTVVSGSDISDIDAEAVELYRKVRAKVNPNAEELQWGDLELLAALSAIRRVGSTYHPTVAGILLFGTRQALRRLFPMIRVDYIRVPGKEWVSDPENRFSTIDMRGNLLQLVQRVQNAIFDDLPKGFNLAEGEIQAETPALSTRVLREAIVNALMHRSYKVQSPVQVIKYSNRIEIRNPGYSLKAEELLGDPGSESRNPYISAIFHETNFAETKGSGIRTMRRIMEASGFVPPTFESDRQGNCFIARFLLHHFLTANDLKWLSLFEEIKLNEAQKRGLVFLRETGALDNLTYRQLNGIDAPTASQDLRRLRAADLLEMKGQSTATYYIPGIKFPNSIMVADLKDLSKSTPSPEPYTQAKELHTQDSEVYTQATEPYTQRAKVHTQGDYSDLSQGELLEIANQVGRRASIEKVQDAILVLCRRRSFKAEELSTILKRNQVGLTRRYLTPMVESGLLSYTLPNSPNHPQQGYIASYS